jgi:chemotaxis protein methyltransferase CheR
MNVIDEMTTQRFRQTVARHLGLQIDERQIDELLRVLRERTQQTGVRDASRYLDLLGTNRDELRVLARLLTTGETYFCRNHEQFTALLEVALPDRMRARERQGSRVLRFLSAGCSSGEEPYTLAMLLRDHPVDLDGWRVEITAIDVNEAALDKARRGRYSTWSLRETPPALYARYFRQRGDELVLDPSIVSAVRFEERNLLDANPDIWQPEHYDVVFCRNVTMYFAEETTRTIIAHVAQSLARGGYLFLGHAETLRRISHAFHLHHTHDTFYYQQRTEGDAHEGSPSSDGASWIDVISRAAERVADMTAPRSRDAPAVVPPIEIESALQLLREERFDDALEQLDGMSEPRRDEPAAQLLRAVLLTNRGDLALAEQVCGKLLELDELNAEAHYLLALGHEQRGDRVQAADHDRTAAYLDAAFAMPRLHLGLMAKRTGDQAAARRELDEALVLLRDESDARLLLFGGGFSRQGLLGLCVAERRALASEGGTK